MLKYKTIPSTIYLEADGSLARSILPDLVDIEKIIVTTSEFSSDLEAFNSINSALNTIQDLRTFEEKTEFNPEFFGNDAEISSEEEYYPSSNGMVMFKVPFNFDELGDFVSIRKKIFSEDSSITIKILVDPAKYVDSKVQNFVSTKKEVGINNGSKFILH